MAKFKSKRKQAASLVGNASKKPKTTAIVTPPPEKSTAEPKTIQSLGLEADDLDIAVDTLNTLAQNPSVIKSKQCRDLRTAVYEFKMACTTGFNAAVDTNLTARISGAIADGGYTEARILLAEMRIRGQKPKLGALCRWVRDIDAVSGVAEQLNGGPERTPHQEELLVMLDAILRVTGPIDHTTEKKSVTGPVIMGPMIPRKPWDLRDDDKTRQEIYEMVLSRKLLEFAPADTKSRFRIVETTPGLERRPPNLHPAILYASQDDTIKLASTDTTTRKVSHHKHPIVPNLHLLKDVLSQDECKKIIAAAETVGFTPDAPIRAEGEESSILAHNFYWIIDTVFASKLWSRVSSFVPAQVGGRKVRGLNRRFRVYRYVPGAEYRAHIDGAWPPSGINLKTDTYIYDSSPEGAKQSSLYTFLIYLNDEFDAGETTYFLPSTTEGRLNAYSIKPIQGSVAMFPHGETEGSLLHEGTGVRKEEKPSAKYVIRTDVLYDVDASPDADT